MKVSILFGGASFEHEISIVSAIAMIQKIRDRIEYCIFLDAEHNFYLIDIANMTSKYFSSKDYKKAKKIEIGLGGFYELGLLGKKKLVVSGMILNLIHGGDGEDGTLSGMLDFFGIKYIGPRVEGSVLSFNKHFTKVYAKELGINYLEYVTFRRGDSINMQNLPFGFPMIIKPMCLGSSIGVSVVNDAKELEYALDSAFEFDERVIIEPFIRGIQEYNLAGAKIEGNFIFSIVEEPQKKDLLNFDDKYLDFSRTQEILSANISDDLKVQMQEIFKKIYGNLFDGALIRCDFFVINRGGVGYPLLCGGISNAVGGLGENANSEKIYLNEINPVPGSMANYLFQDFEDVIMKLASNLPRKNHIKVNYNYINRINYAKGK